MRLLALILALVAAPVVAAEYPLWNGEPVEEYAKKVNLPPTKTLDLGNGVKLELVLIPAGKFVMGTEEPKPVDELHFQTQIGIGQVALAVSVGVMLVMLGFVIVRAIRGKHRPQVSLARLLVLALTAGVGLMGGLHWQFSARALTHAQDEYQADLARFRNSYPWERPAHEVTLTKPVYIGKYEVTQEQYEQVMGTNPSRYRGRNLPVETVSWDDAQEFCKKVSEKTGSIIRLPTEAEWEHACRAGTKTAYCSGDTEADADRVAWHNRNRGDNPVHPVGQKCPNAWGLYDMHGNVFELCADLRGDYKAEAAMDPQGPELGEQRVLRGGAWGFSFEVCRSSNRQGSMSFYRSSQTGFRVAARVSKTQL